MSETPADRPIVLVHGLGGSAADTWQGNGWMDLIGDAGRPTIGIDLLGHGTAEKPHDPAAYADMHRHVLDALPDEPVDAIGFSLGAITLLRCASEAPERFARLVCWNIPKPQRFCRWTGYSSESPDSTAHQRYGRHPGFVLRHQLLS